MSTKRSLRSPLAEVITRYLSLNRALGRKFAIEEGVLVDLDGFLAGEGASGSELTSDSFVRWCAGLQRLTPSVRRNWMRIVRNLCLYRNRHQPGGFVPDLATFPQPHAPRLPHLFSEQDIVRLLEAADELQTSSNSPLRPQVFRLAIVLLYTTGMRRAELTQLKVDDYDPAEQSLRIRATKFHKSRILPLSADAARETEQYLQARRRLPRGSTAPLLCNRSRGLRAYTGAGLAQGLRRLYERAGVMTSAGRPPRVHDLRHSFAIAALLRWYRQGDDVQARLPALATYMGHGSIASTLHYLRHFEAVAQLASERFAQHCDAWPAMVTGGDR